MNYNFEEQMNKTKEFFQKYWIPIVGAIIALAVIISLVNIYKEQVLDLDSDVKYEKQNTIYLASNSIDTLNPVTTITEDSYYINKLIYDGLFEFTNNLSVMSKLVDSYKVNTEKAYIEIKLKSGVKFHDGNTLTADDVKFTINAILSQGNKSLYYPKVSKITLVTVENDNNLKIFFKNNYECSLDCLTFPIVSSKQYGSVSAFLKAENFTPIGTGEYKYSEYDPYKALELVPNNSYFGTKATKNVTVQIVPDKNNLDNLIENGTITCYVDRGSDRKTVVTDNEFKMYDMISNEVDFIYFNTSSGIFKDKDARKAAAYAIDSKSVLEKGYMNDGVLSDTIYYPNFLGVADTGTSYVYNEESAELLLSGLGYKDKNLDGKLEDKKEKDLTVKILVNSNNANRIAAAKVIQNNLESIGLSATVNAVPWDNYQKLIKNKDFDILITGYLVEESYDLRTLFNGKALWGYKNNNLLNQARLLDRLYTSQEYTDHYSKLKDMLLDELPYYPLCYKKMGVIGIDTLEVNSLPMFNDIYKNVSTWEWSQVIVNKE